MFEHLSICGSRDLIGRLDLSRCQLVRCAGISAVATIDEMHMPFGERDPKSGSLPCGWISPSHGATLPVRPAPIRSALKLAQYRPLIWKWVRRGGELRPALPKRGDHF